MAIENKKILIIFPDHWFAYSPTVTNIFNLLAEEFDIQVVALEREINGRPACVRIDDQRVHYVKFFQMPKFLWRIIGKMGSIYNRCVGRFSKEIEISRIFQATVLFWACRKIKADEVIGVDAVGFYVAQALFKEAHLVSLEISTHDIFYERLVKNVSKIKSVIIQSEERLRLLNLPLKKEQKVFIVQNAPIYNESIHPCGFNNKMIYLGSGQLSMGIKYLFEYFTLHKKYSLVFKGLFDTHLFNRHFPGIMAQSNIQFDQSYTSNQDIQEYLTGFSIGLCFYDFDHIAESARQNMFHGPSGKIFNYFASGLPVIASDIPGFKMVREYSAGILLENPTPQNIDNAIEQIKANYSYYSENSRRAAKHFCFKNAFYPFLEYIEGRPQHALS